MTPPPRFPRTPESLAAQDHDPRECVMLAVLDERQQQDRADLQTLVGKVDRLCTDIAPLVPWVRDQMTEAAEESSWRRSLVRDVTKYIVSVVLVGLGALVLSHPGELIAQVRNAIGGP